MTTGNNMPLSNGASPSATPSASAITAVNGVARQLYRRARTAGPEFADVAAEVRNLHRVLKHLCVEAEDPDSPLNHDGAAAAPGSTETVYARRLTPVLEETDFTLKQLETMLAKYGSGGESAEEGATGRASSPIIEIEGREREMLARIQSKLAMCKTDIDIFLDTIQLHHPARARQNLDKTDGHQLDAIKDKVDAIARRLFARRGSGSSDNDEELWVQFRSELERAGFSSDVLRKNKEVLRAYIRELDLRGYLEAEEPPTVRGMLNHQPRNGPPMMITPASYPGPQQHGGLIPDGYPPSSQQYSQELQPRQAHSYQPPPMFPQGSSGLSYEPYNSSSSDSESSDSTGDSQSLVLISTRDLIILDRKEADAFNARLAAMHLSPQYQLPPPSNYSISPGTSPNGRYLPAPPQPIPIQAPPTSAPGLPPAHQLSSSPGSQQLLGVSPRYVPPVLVPGYGRPGGPQLLPPPGGLSPSSSVLTPPPAYGSSPTTAGALIAPLPRPQHSRLQPDSTGRDIPLDATWTKIRRTLVSTEVLERAGVRYEARPEFVAVLGMLSREQIAEYARQSEVVRQARRRGGGRSRGANGHSRGERGSDGRRQYPVRHPAPSDDKKRDGSSGRKKQDSGSDSDVLWDESDTTDEEHSSRRRRRGGSGRSKDKRANGTSTGASSTAQAKYTPKTYIDPSAEAARDSSADDKGSRFIVNPPSMAAAAAAGAAAATMSGALSGSEGKTSPSSTVLPKPILKNKNENHVRFDEDGPKEISQDELRRERERESRRRRDGKDKDGQNRDKKDRDGRRRHHHHHHRDGSGSQGAGSTGSQRQKDRAIKKSVWGETLGAVGIGGAAASLLSVLTEAAAGF